MSMGISNKVLLIATISLIIIGMLLIGESTGNTISVKKDGAGDFTTIQQALENSNSNDSIIISNGEYYENLMINKSIHISGEKGENVIINGNGTGNCIEINQSYVSISNIQLRNADFGIYLRNTNNTSVYNATITDMDFVAIHIGNSIDNTLSNITCSNSNIGLKLHYSDNNSIINSSFQNNILYNIFNYYSNGNSYQDILCEQSTISITNIQSTNNRFSHLSINNNSYHGIYFANSIANSINASRFRNNSQYDVFLADKSICSATNISINNVSLSIEDDCKFELFNELIITFLNVDLSGISNAETIISSNLSMIYATPKYGGVDNCTNANGSIIPLTIKYMQINGNEIVTYSCNLKISKDEWSYETNISLDGPKFFIFINDPPIFTSEEIRQSHYNESTIIQFEVTCTDESLKNVTLLINETYYGMEELEGSFYCELSFPAGEYKYQFIGFDGLVANSTDWKTFTVFDDHPPMPINIISLHNLPNGSIQLSWEPSEADDFSYYNIYVSNSNYSRVDDILPHISIYDSEIGTITINGLISEMPYYFSLTAIDYHGNEARSVNAIMGIPIKQTIEKSKMKMELFEVGPSVMENWEELKIFYQIQNIGNTTISECSTIIIIDNITVYNKTIYNCAPGSIIEDMYVFKPMDSTLTIQIFHSYDNNVNGGLIFPTFGGLKFLTFI